MVMKMMNKQMDMVNVNEPIHHQYLPIIILNEDENPNENYPYAKKLVEI
jgi:hypothetical protein